MKLNDIFYYFTWDPGSVLRRSVPARYLSLFVWHDAMGKLVASRRPALWSDDLLSNNQDGIRTRFRTTDGAKVVFPRGTLVRGKLKYRK